VFFTFREAIIYGGKSIIKVNEVKEHLLNKDKIDKQLNVSFITMIPSKCTLLRSNNESSMSNQKRNNLVCNWCHKKGHIRVDRWAHKKKQQDANTIELSKGDEDKCDVLSVTDSLVDNKDRWIIDFGCSQHMSSDKKMFSYTSIQGRVVFIKNSATSKVIGKGTIQFRSHDGCITTLQGVRHVPESSYNLISLGALNGEGFDFSSKDDLMEVSKDAQLKFQAERVSSVYMLRNAEITVDGL